MTSFFLLLLLLLSDRWMDGVAMNLPLSCLFCFVLLCFHFDFDHHLIGSSWEQVFAVVFPQFSNVVSRSYKMRTRMV